MTDNQRDTKFLSFARLLIEDLRNLPYFDGSVYQEGVDTLIAQRAYDLAVHVVDAIRETTLPESIVSDIPDLTQWPELPGSPPPEHLL